MVNFLLRSELIKERDQSLLEKTKLKEIIKKYEIEFIKQSGRPLSKEDREFHKDDFERYKVSRNLDFFKEYFDVFLIIILDFESKIETSGCIDRKK